MQDVRLQRLSLKNFKGIKSFDLPAGGENCSIYGDNATGKTTLVDAFLWLLFGKDSLNQANFEIKPLGADGEPEHGLEHGVAAQINVGGKVITLRKVLSEKWTKKRGSAAKEFTGHETAHFIDGVQKPKKDFDAAVNSICDEQLFRMLTNPRFFNETMHWQKRRELLLEVCGNVSDQDVIQSDPELSPLAKIERSLDDQRKMLTARRAEINKELEKLPVRVDECRQLAAQVPEGKASDVEIANLHNLLTMRQNELARITAGGEVAEKTKALREIEARIIANETAQRRLWQASFDAATAKRSKISAEIELSQSLAKIRAGNIPHIEDQLLSLRKRWLEVDARPIPVGTICPTCEQPLPPDKIAEATARANQAKAEELAEISGQGKGLKTTLDELKAEQQQLLDSAASMAPELEAADAAITALGTFKLNILDREYQELMHQKVNLEMAIQGMASGSDEVRQEAQDEIDRLRGEIDKQVAWREQERAAKHARQRIDALKAEERTLAGEYERIEQELALLDKFTRAKVGMLEGRINGKFQIARFKLFQEQINGGVTECCEVVVDGVPYSSLNNAMRINVGLDVINTLSEHYKVRAPIFVDNAEAITRLIETSAQQIRLVVSEQDKELRIETKQAAKDA